MTVPETRMLIMSTYGGKIKVQYVGLELEVEWVVLQGDGCIFSLLILLILVIMNAAT